MTPKLRAVSEVIIELFCIFFYIWFLKEKMPFAVHFTFFWLACVGFPIYCIGSGQRFFPEFSLDWDNFLKSLRGILWFTLIGTAVLMAISIYSKGFHYDGKFLVRLPEYFFWGFLQQIALQTFLTRRARKIVHNSYGAAGISSTIFALIHFPNPALAILSWSGAFFWSLSFQKRPNLYALAMSHGWLAVTALYCVPNEWTHSLRVGPTYWTY